MHQSVIKYCSLKLVPKMKAGMHFWQTCIVQVIQKQTYIINYYFFFFLLLKENILHGQNMIILMAAQKRSWMSKMRIKPDNHISWGGIALLFQLVQRGKTFTYNVIGVSSYYIMYMMYRKKLQHPSQLPNQRSQFLVSWKVIKTYHKTLQIKGLTYSHKSLQCSIRRICWMWEKLRTKQTETLLNPFEYK